MHRYALPPVRTLLRALAISIALVVASRTGAEPLVRATSAAAVLSFTEHRADPSFKVGGRVEPRVFPAPFSDRLPAVVPSSRVGIFAGARIAVDATSLLERRVDDRRTSILKHLPRLERGDPPRA